MPFGTFLERDLGVPFDQLRHAFFEKCWFEIVTGKLPMRPALESALAQIAPDVGVESVIQYWFEHDSRLDQALIADLQNLKQLGVRIYLATNQEHERAAYLMETLALKNVASGIFYSAALGCRKPSEEFYRKATKQSGVHAQEIMFIDDMAENIEAARAFGWQAAQWSSGMSLQDVLPADWLR